MPASVFFSNKRVSFAALLTALASLPAAAPAAPGELAQSPLTCTPTASAVAFSSQRLAADPILFQSSFDSSDWSGDLLALDVDSATGDVNTTTPLWSAATKLNTALASSRLILTRGASGGVPLTSDNWDNLTEAQKRDLRTNSDDTLASEDAGKLRLGYLRGEQGCEDAGGCIVDLNNDGDSDDPEDVLQLRRRTLLLGDIIHAGPIVVGAPQMYWPPDRIGGETYPAFKSNIARRTPVVYVGANDGMLHGFKATASGGEELIAYVPEALSSSVTEGLHRLTGTSYNEAGGHRYYVDRTPAVSDVYIDSGGRTEWRTLAVGGLGAGGRGLYALDITDPSGFTAGNASTNVLWEFSSADDAELGYTFSQPVIGLMNNGRWAAIVSSGYRDTGSDQAHLLIVFLERGIDGADYIKIPATLAGLTERNGLSSAAVADLDGNGTADRVYAGDLLGNLWVFDVSATSTDNWRVAGSGEPLFHAGANQPITIKPEIAKHPSVDDITGDTEGNNQPNLMVYFGTGQYLTDTDETTTATQSFYGVWDRGDFGRTRGSLQQQRFEEGFNDEVVTDDPVDWTTQYGWYLDLPAEGERVVVDATLRGGVVFFNSLVPSEVSSDCTGFLYAVSVENGGRPAAPAFDRNGDAVVDLADFVTSSTDSTDKKVASRAAFAGAPTASTFIDNYRYTGGSSEGGGLDKDAVFEIKGAYTGRLSWQQLNRE